MLHALTRAPGPKLADCELTHLAREPIDAHRAADEHRGYEEILEQLGCTIVRVPPAPELPDAVFVEDAAVVLPELALITRSGAESRRAETASVAAVLDGYRELHEIEAPATLDGGDVLVLGKTLYVGLSSRTNRHALAQLDTLLEPLGYAIVPVQVTRCLHLKSAATRAADGLVVINPEWADEAAFAGMDIARVDPREPHAANVLAVGGSVLCNANCPRTRERLEKLGLDARPVVIRELAKAEAGLSCMSVVFDA